MNSGRMQDSTAESMHVEANANVNVNRFTLPKDARDLIVATVTAASLLLNVWLINKAFNAEKDRQTYQMLCADGLTKFEQGPFADMKAHVLALEMVQKEKRP
jgi:hypothetical protein